MCQHLNLSSVLPEAEPWTWIALEVHYMCTCLKKKNAEIRKTLFHYRNNTFQLPLLLLNGKNSFPAEKGLHMQIKWHTLEKTPGFGWFETWRCTITFFKPSVNQSVLFLLGFSYCKRGNLKPQLLQGKHITISCLMRNSWKLHLALPWDKSVLCSLSGMAGAIPMAWHIQSPSPEASWS